MQQYANTEKSIPEIAEELNVETVMEGSVRYANGQIRITTQLSSSATAIGAPKRRARYAVRRPRRAL